MKRNPVALYMEMKKRDFSSILDTAVRECGVKTPERARELLDAFLQWFSLIPQSTPAHPLQMLRSVDRIWHAMILNTVFYRKFCDDFVGGFVDHNPMDVVQNSTGKEEYARHTLELLERSYGVNVNKELLELKEDTTCCSGCDSLNIPLPKEETRELVSC